ncbi:NAD-dependent deacetylase [Lentilactobacillus raoultii]|uniref:protein acetyllysine N-acetyltransferase n=2 Tax=Lentilactobacillus raoultii TaxID=1987503 RepID=A0ABW3PDS9_9LACO|nr:Sir2 family NAD-dependent protein deacetylase [Lentilactobacillus raoultii]
MTNKSKTSRDLIDAAAHLISKSSHIVAFTGAGISTESRIPDLLGISRILGADRHFDGDVFGMLDSRFAESRPEEFYRLYRKTFFQPKAKPNFAHKFLAWLESQGKLAGIVTMNIDYLHQLAGSKTVFEYWGDMRKNHCSYCHRPYDWDIIKEQSVPLCPVCGHVIIPDFVMRNLATYQDEISGGRALLAQADLLLIIGTRRSSNSFTSGIPKIVINDEISDQIQNQTLKIHGKSTVIFKELNCIIKK